MLLLQVLTRPYSIGYSILEIALSQNLPTASMINKAGTTVVANYESVRFAVMDMGGALTTNFQGSLSDGSATHVWPISGFTYFIIRKYNHIAPGNCKRRTAAMEYLYNFYTSDIVREATNKFGFSALPRFLATKITDFLVENAMCDNGEYALAKRRISPTPILGATIFAPPINDYLTGYTAVDPEAKWNFQHGDISHR